MKECSSVSWKPVLFDLDGPDSRFTPEGIWEYWTALTERLRSIDGCGAPELLTDRPDVASHFRAKGVATSLVPTEPVRSQEERLLWAARSLTAEPHERLLACNLHYPMLRTETLARAVAEGLEQPALSVRQAPLPPHRYFTFRSQGGSKGESAARPSGDVLLEWKINSQAQILGSSVDRPAGASAPTPDAYRVWGTLSPAEGADAYGWFEIDGKWTFDYADGGWVNTEEGRKPIAGRKDYPTVASLADAWICGPAASLKDLNEAIRRGINRAVPLEGEEAIRLTSPLDALRVHTPVVR